MGRINESAIDRICAKTLNTSSVQAKISELQRKAIANNKTLSVQSQKQMEEAGQKLLDTIIKHLPTSLSHIGKQLTGCISSVHSENGQYQIDVVFPTEIIRRESLYSDEYDGVDNIIALFNNGYKAKNPVYGYWKPADKRVRSTVSRSSLKFMQEAIDEFNSAYGNQYACRAKLGEQYK